MRGERSPGGEGKRSDRKYISPHQAPQLFVVVAESANLYNEENRSARERIWERHFPEG